MHVGFLTVVHVMLEIGVADIGLTVEGAFLLLLEGKVELPLAFVAVVRLLVELAVLIVRRDVKEDCGLELHFLFNIKLLY